MARQRHQGNESASGLTVLAAEADRLAERHQISTEQARHCLGRLVAAFASSLMESPEVLESKLHRFPLSILDDALSVLPQTSAILLVGQGDLGLLARRIRHFEWLIDENTPLYSLAELVGHTESFLTFLNTHRDYLIQTGLPPRTFRDSRWLYINLGRLYDTRATRAPWPFDEFYFPRDVPLPDQPPFKWIRTPEHGAFSGSQITNCGYDEADYLKGISSEDAERIEADRDRLFSVKIRFLELLIDTGRNRKFDQLWPTFMGLLQKVFSADDLKFFLQMDRTYLGANATDDCELEFDPKMVPGGLTNWIHVLGHFEKEIRIGTLARARAKMPVDLVQKLTNWQGDSLGQRWAYLNIVDQPDRARFDAMLGLLQRRIEQERLHWSTFRQRVTNSFCDGDRIPVTVLVPSDAASWMQPFLQSRIDQVSSGLTNALAHESGRTKLKRVQARFHSPNGLTWPEVRMEFVSETKLRVTARGVSEAYMYTDLGFRDLRKTDLPDKPWEILKLMAAKVGELSKGSPRQSGGTANARKMIQTLNQRLKTLMQMESKPIVFVRGKGYQPLFRLSRDTLDKNLSNTGKKDFDE